jgi:hypothetical protein
VFKSNKKNKITHRTWSNLFRILSTKSNVKQCLSFGWLVGT